MRKSTMILGTVFLILAMAAALFLVGGALSAKVDVMTASGAEYPKAFASIQGVLQTGAPQLFSEGLPEDPAACRLEDVTITLSNRGLFPAEWLDIHAEAAPGDIAVYSLTGEGSDIPARDTAQVNLKLVTTAMPDAVRDITIQYHIHGMQRTITVR